jgi:hypothetical protein
MAAERKKIKVSIALVLIALWINLSVVSYAAELLSQEKRLEYLLLMDMLSVITVTLTSLPRKFSAVI